VLVHGLEIPSLPTRECTFAILLKLYVFTALCYAERGIGTASTQVIRVSVCPSVTHVKYACPVWHNSLTNEQCHQIESIQRRALKIICGQNYTAYNEICSNLKLSSFVDRRSALCKAFFLKVCWCQELFTLSVTPTRPDSVHRLRQHLPYIPQIHKTSRYYYSFIPFALNNYRFTDVVSIAVLSLVIMSFIAASRICILICALFNFVFSLQSSTCAAILLNKTIYVAYVCMYVSWIVIT